MLIPQDGGLIKFWQADQLEKTPNFLFKGRHEQYLIVTTLTKGFFY
jgi:hypothetical protein